MLILTTTRRKRIFCSDGIATTTSEADGARVGTISGQTMRFASSSGVVIASEM
jgi:hypothetical protein